MVDQYDAGVVDNHLAGKEDHCLEGLVSHMGEGESDWERDPLSLTRAL